MPEVEFDEPRQLNITLVGADGTHTTLDAAKFEYRDNPIVDNILPKQMMLR